MYYTWKNTVFHKDPVETKKAQRVLKAEYSRMAEAYSVKEGTKHERKTENIKNSQREKQERNTQTDR